MGDKRRVLCTGLALATLLLRKRTIVVRNWGRRRLDPAMARAAASRPDLLAPTFVGHG